MLQLRLQRGVKVSFALRHAQVQTVPNLVPSAVCDGGLLTSDRQLPM